MGECDCSKIELYYKNSGCFNEVKGSSNWKPDDIGKTERKNYGSSQGFYEVVESPFLEEDWKRIKACIDYCSGLMLDESNSE